MRFVRFGGRRESRRVPRSLAQVVPGVLLTLSAARVSGQTVTWTGTGNDDLWSDTGNWVASTPPVPDGVEAVDFPASALPYLSDQNVTPFFALSSMSFENATTLTGDSIQLDDHTTITTSANVTIDNELVLGGNFTVNGNGDLNLAGYLALTGSSTSGLVMQGTGAVALSGGTSQIHHLNVSSGAVSMSGGSLTCTSTDVLGSTEALSVGAATLTLAGGAIFQSPATSYDTINGGGTMTVTDPGTNFVLPVQLFVGDLSGGSLTLNNSATATGQSGGVVYIGDAATGQVLVEGGSSSSTSLTYVGFAGGSASLTLTGSGSTWNTSVLTVGQGGPAGSTGVVNVQSGATLAVTGSTAFSSNGASINVNGGTYTTALLQGGQVGNISLTDPGGSAAMTINGASGSGSYGGGLSGFGTIIKTGGSAQTFTGASSFLGSIVIDGGSIVLGSSSALQDANIVVNQGNGLSTGGLGNAAIGTLSGSGDVNLGGTTLTLGSANGSGSYSGTLSAGSGGLNKVGSGYATFTGTASSVNFINISAGGVPGGIVLSGGSLAVTSSVTPIGSNDALVVKSSSFTVQNGATFDSSAAGLCYIGSSGGNAGTATLTGSGSSWLLSQTLGVGFEGLGNFTVSAGAVATDPNGAAAIIGFAGSGSVLVEGGSSVTVEETTMAAMGGDSATLTVTGANSVWNTMTVGAQIGGEGSLAGGSATINVNAGGAFNSGVNTKLYDGNDVVNVNGGTFTAGLLASGPGAATINLLADPAAGHALVIDDINAGDNRLFFGSITGSGSLLKTGAAAQTLGGANSYSGGTFVNGGALVISANGALADGAVNISGGTLQLATSTGLATITSLSITGGGTFDVNNNHVIITYGDGPDPIASIAALLQTGYNAGLWNGAGGIVSSAAALTSTSYGLGYADAADTGNPAGLSSGQIEIKYTLLGDVNLDGAVNGVDFGILAANFNKGVTGWDKGDFNYDNSVNGVDFGELAANFNKGASGGAGGASALDDAAIVAFAEANGLMADLTSVPEPASFMLLVGGSLGMLKRRRGRRKRAVACAFLEHLKKSTLV